jgi:hypothetical protein
MNSLFPLRPGPLSPHQPVPSQFSQAGSGGPIFLPGGFAKISFRMQDRHGMTVIPEPILGLLVAKDVNISSRSPHSLQKTLNINSLSMVFVLLTHDWLQRCRHCK